LSYGTLFVVATPIGNRDDLSLRARQVLTDADLIAAEDTRHTGRLLSHFGIKSRQIALHDYNEQAILDDIILQLKSGKSVALVSDAGTPLISDPGFRLLRAAHEQDIPVSPIPGASALVAALSVAGLPTDRFCFEGFLPARHGMRVEKLKAIGNECRTIIFYESVHRIKESIGDMNDVFGSSRRAFIGRELSKMYEQCILATLGELKEMLHNESIMAKGEFVVVVEGAVDVASDIEKVDVNQLLIELQAALPGKQAVTIASKITGRRKNDLYQLMLNLKDEPANSR
jgi:16S rRNA (cytidine1402-2'-O)-methyltransferase